MRAEVRYQSAGVSSTKATNVTALTWKGYGTEKGLLRSFELEVHYRGATESASRVLTANKAQPRDACPSGSVLLNSASYAGAYADPYALLRITCSAQGQLQVQWGPSIGGLDFDTGELYGTPWMPVDQVVPQKAYTSFDWMDVGAACEGAYSKGASNKLRAACFNDICIYEVKAGQGGDCPWSELALRAYGSILR